VQSTSWADGLEFTGDDDRLLGHAGALPLRLLAEQAELRTGLSAAMRRGFNPAYDRGQVLVDLALMLILGGEAISDFQGLRHLVSADAQDAHEGVIRGEQLGLGESGADRLAGVHDDGQVCMVSGWSC
jgi:hypothetical protein